MAAQFGISPNQATQDIEAVEGYASLRGLDDPRIILAMRLLHDAGHPLGWPDPRLEAADAALAILAAAGTSRDDLTTEDWRRIVAGCFG